MPEPSLLDLCMRLREHTRLSTTAEDRARLHRKIQMLLPAEANAERAAVKVKLRAVEARTVAVKNTA